MKKKKRIMPKSISVYFNEFNDVVLKEVESYAKENNMSTSRAAFYLLNLGLRHKQEISLPSIYKEISKEDEQDTTQQERLMV